ncbi:hypothetical protein AN915_26580 [Mycobacteroides immunogenum]|uniref:Abortive infection protein n=1 Tax=Mycobacteroides immunogenum TaxID=83262 RepID=A0ABR5LKJ0_9MYCO|nr:hypothetical protein AN912_25650 [Mycobacteroides immunogenum]KPG26307.1 hypothetical protein AN913_21335 [Mycobacteroides immunogenum]KPG39702.1 hypothetical protein AN915_26580 [Mycobacteroides immunogenum]
MLLLRSRPAATVRVRAVLLYSTGAVAAFGIPMLVAIFRVIWPVHASEPAPQTDLRQLAWRVTAACLSLWVFFIVRAWKLNGHNAAAFRRQQRLTSPRAHWRCWFAAASAFVVGEFAAVSAQGELKDKFGLEFNQNSHPKGGQFSDWLPESAFTALSGLQEEPVIVGVAVLLWPGLRLRRLAAVAALTSACRAIPHLYYAADNDLRHAALVSISVVVWSALWSTGALLAVYYSRTLTPVIVAHGLWNSLVTAGQHWEVPMVLRIVQGAAVFVVLFGGLRPLFDVVWGRMFQLVTVRFREKSSVPT